MAKTDIFCVGFKLPGDEIVHVPFNSGMSLLDADVILFEPNLEYQTESLNPTYQGKPSLSETSSDQTRSAVEHWRSELKQAFDAGKTIFLFLKKPEEVYAHTGTQEFSGTGRSQKVIHHVGLVRNYDCLPLTFQSLTAATGQKVKFTADGSLLAAFWKAMGDISFYEVHYDHKGSNPLMLTQSGDRTVASLIRGKSGNMILLPPLDFSDDDFRDWTTPYVPKWTSKAVKRGHALVSCLVEIHRALRSSAARSPAPDWCRSESYQLETERKLLRRIAEIDNTMQAFAAERRDCSQRLDSETLPRALLYESGKPLELAIIDALRTFGFTADRYADNESEFDIVFQSPEGRFLGEAEGRNNAPISIDKFQQLERNIQEDFSKDGVGDYAKGVLFGNPHRLTEPEKREELFTAKALSAAKRTGVALVHTSDLFPLVQYLKGKSDPPFAQRIRQAFATTAGAIVKFPPVPGTKASRTGTEQSVAGDA